MQCRESRIDHCNMKKNKGTHDLKKYKYELFMVSAALAKVLSAIDIDAPALKLNLLINVSLSKTISLIFLKVVDYWMMNCRYIFTLQ